MSELSSTGPAAGIATSPRRGPQDGFYMRPTPWKGTAQRVNDHLLGLPGPHRQSNGMTACTERRTVPDSEEKPQ